MQLIKGTEIEGQEVTYQLPNGGTITHEYHAPVVPVLADEIAQKIIEIKAQAAARIVATGWQVERAKERDLLNSTNTLLTVLTAREAIRAAGNAAEANVSTLITVDAVHAFVW